MTTSSNVSALRIELQQAFSFLQPRIRGLEDFIKFIAPDSELYKALQDRLEAFKGRRDRIRSTGAELNHLEEDGYPDIEKLFLNPPSVEVLQTSLADLTAAVSAFDSLPIVQISLGEPKDK